MTEMQRLSKDYWPILDGPTRYHGGYRRRLTVRTAEVTKYWNWLHQRMYRPTMEVGGDRWVI